MVKGNVVMMTMAEDSQETTVRDNAHETEVLNPRFEKGKQKLKKLERDASPASRYFRKPVAAQ